MDDRVIKAIGDPKRYLLLTLLAERSYCVQALAHRCQLSESSVSQHLKILREAGLIVGEKRGYYTHYHIDREGFKQVIDELAQLLEIHRMPCDGPFYGCPEAQYIRCRAYVSPQDRKKDD